MPKSYLGDPEFRRDAPLKFQRIYEQAGSLQSAGDSIGVSKQQFEKYLKGEKAPSYPTLQRIRERWKLTFRWRGTDIPETPREPSGPTARTPTPLQLPLRFDDPSVADPGNTLTVKIGSKSTGTYQLTLRIEASG